MARAVRPTLHWLAAHEVEYRGVLYAGMMLTADGPRVIEYNVRFGDPECQVVLPRVASDFAELLRAAAAGEPLAVEFARLACVTVVLAGAGYPASARTGDAISGLDVATAVNEVTIFHAGTARDADGTLRTAGGRVLAVTGTGPDLSVARTRAYEAAGLIAWDGMQLRGDIAAAAAATEAGSEPAPWLSGPDGGSAPRR
jgi:phosphoribosylamine---glycine ligase